MLSHQFRLAHLMIMLSQAADLGMNQSLGWGGRGCLLAMRFAQVLGVNASDLRDVYYLSLLHYLGCTTDAHRVAEFFGNDLAVMRYFALNHMGKLPSAEMPSPAKAPDADWQRASSANRCEVAVNLAKYCGFWPSIQQGLWQLFERWNGEGLPHGLRGNEINLPVRIVQIAQDVETFYRIGGLEAAIAVIKARTGSGYDPRLAKHFCNQASELISSVEVPSLTQVILAAEPDPPHLITDSEIERVLEVVADFVDIKSPYTAGHSRGVAQFATAAAAQLGLDNETTTLLHHAALLHDLGHTGVPTSITDKAGRLTDPEWEQVWLHPYYTERILASSDYFRQVGAIASLHHERLDGSGYHRQVPAMLQPLAARILAAAEAFQSMIEPRAYRPALPVETAAQQLQQAAQTGWLDVEATEAILAIAGHPLPTKQRQWAGGLSQREVEVLRLLARGYSNRAIAEHYTLSVKTVGHHVQHIYNKLNVSTRAAATLFAMQHGLVQI